MPIDLILGADSISAPLTGIGRYAFELARGLPQHPEVGRVRYFSLGRWASFESLLSADTAPPRQQRSLRSILAGNRWAVQAFRLLMPPLQRLRLRHQGEAIYHSPNYFLPPFAGRTVATIHDLSHHIYPQFHPAARADYVRRMLPDSLRRASHLITDAESVRRELIEHFNYPADQITAIPLGADPAFCPHSAAELAPVLGRWGLQPHNYSLYVGTIEPRKNHAYLLDAFERAWATGSKARLCIVGKIGWKCEALIERIRLHPELNRRLFMDNTLSDKSLEHAYSHATALVFPSYVEGFGLPLVEAMQRGLPAMASDIPVFREIGGDYMAYFDLANPQSLTHLITDMERSQVFPAPLSLEQWRWLSWREASAQLIERIEHNLHPSPAIPESQHAHCS